MATRKTINFLPDIFRSDVNKKFLGATLDQLMSEPNFTKVDGFAGRKFSLAYGTSSSYIVEPTTQRQNYQLEPAVVVKNSAGLIDLYSDYKDIVDKIGYYGGVVDNHDRLFKSEYYNYNPRIDLDKFVNYTRYYWLPNGPDAVTISVGNPEVPKTYTVTRGNNSYTTDLTAADLNPDITLVRGVTYNFDVNQVGNAFWIQTEPGTDGYRNFSQRTSTREIFGVTGNGADVGRVTFTVPQKESQDYYYKSPILDFVSYAVTTPFSLIDGSLWNRPSANIVSDFDGNTDFPDGAYIVFLGGLTPNLQWTTRTGSTVPVDKRKGLWQIKISDTSQIQLEYVRDIPIGHRILVNQGNTNGGREYFKNSAGLIVQSPPITAALSTLYYQDGTNESTYGRITIVDGVGDDINVDTDIVGKKTYTAPRGIVFTNGLKITFDGTIFPLSYRNKTYLVDGVGKAIRLVEYSLMRAIESDSKPTSIPFDIFGFDLTNFDEPTLGVDIPEYIVINRSSQDLNAWVRTNRWFHEDVILKTAEYNNTQVIIDEKQRAKRPIIEFEPDFQLFNSGRALLDIIDRIDDRIKTAGVEGTWPKITSAFGQVNNQLVNGPLLDQMNYLEGQHTIFPNDLDSFVRSKVYRVDFKDQRTSLDYDGIGTGLLSVTAGAIKGRDGSRPTAPIRTRFKTELEIGSLVFDWNGTYLGKVVQIPNNNEIIFDQPAAFTAVGRYRFIRPRISLVEIKTATAYDTVVATAGHNLKKSYWYNGSSWTQSQWKTRRNQEPLFDVIDQNDTSLSDTNAYPQSTFAGTKIFSYKPGTGLIDSVLNFSISYSTIGGSVSDISFVNNFDTDTYTYKDVNRITKNISTGYLRKNIGRTAYQVENIWNTVVEPTKQYQHITGVYDGTTNYFEIDIVPVADIATPNLKVYVNNKIIPRSSYSIQTVGVRTAVYVDMPLTFNDSIDIFIYTNQVSSIGYYQIPKNLEFNPLNLTLEYVTLGQIRNHFVEIGNNTIGVVGDLLSNNNVRDLDISQQGGSILKHSAPTLYASLFLTDPTVNFVNGLDLARKDYSRFKNKFLEMCITLPELTSMDVMTGVDLVLNKINGVKNPSFPWFYSGMIPWGDNYVVDTYKIIDPTVRIYSVPNIYDALGTEFFPSNGLANKAVLVYLNGQQLVIDKDYFIEPGVTAVQFYGSLTLNINDIILIKGYRDTDGSYVPETPTKLGLYPKFQPGIFEDATYRADAAINVIQGHDGSITPVFDDLRDQYLLELENRIYNNIRVTYNSALFDINSVRPGKFRKLDYTLTEYNQVLNTEFLKWIGNNQLDYSANEYFQPNDEFTWNYNQTTEILESEKLPGYWRGIYKYFYDTDKPSTHPWEMLGFVQKPSWWNLAYGNAPYLPNNQMWTDLENGFYRNDSTTNPLYARPGLRTVLPVDSTGALKSPQAIMVKTFDGTRFNQPYLIGDQGPVETAWVRSSDYAFAINRATALLTPARYFSLQFDVTSQINDPGLDQYFVNSLNQRINPLLFKINGELVNGNIVRASGYINWIHGYLTNLGLDAANQIRNNLNNVDVRLGYKMASFTDKKYITVMSEQFSPTSNNKSVIIPDENYVVHLNKSVPVRKATYSAVIVEKSSSGYTVSGYNLKYPYFTVIPSEFNGNFYTIEELGVRGVIYQDYKTQKVNVPYGFEFRNIQQIVDFFVGYQRFLSSEGFVFERYDTNLSHQRDWILSAREFISWTLQGWKTGNILVLSPLESSMSIYGIDAAVDTITNISNDSQVLGPNFNVIRTDELSVIREPGVTTITTTSGQTIAYAEINLVQYEHVLVFDNATVFNDIVYKTELGSRQYRLKIIGNKTADWFGELNPPGFMYNTDVVDPWEPEHDYKKADIVEYKNRNYSAIRNIPGTSYFNYEDWSQLDTQFAAGLIPNFAHNANKISGIYDIDSPVIDENFDKFSNGLIGYRSRPYLENIGLNENTQSRFYQGFIKEKGTKNAITAIYSGQFDNIVNDVSIYEEWGLRVGEYGSNKSNQSIDIILNESKYRANPVAFKLLNSADPSVDNLITVRPKDLLNRPKGYRAPVFLNREQDTLLETDIKTAGYVNVNDVDGTLFDFNNYASLSTKLADLYSGYNLWVAKDFNEDWQVYRATLISSPVVTIEYNLDNKARIITQYDHGIQIGDIFAIRGLNSNFDGFYQAVYVEDSNTIVVIVTEAQFRLLLANPIDGSGELFVMQRSRYKDIADKDNDITKEPRKIGDLVWVDNNNDNHWAVYRYVRRILGNFVGPKNSWTIENSSINIRGSGLPYHSFGNAQISTTAIEQNYNRTFPVYGGSNVKAETHTDIGTGLIGFWINGVAITSPDAGLLAPAGYLTVPGFNYDLMYPGLLGLNKDQAGGIVLDSQVYTYKAYTFGNAWLSGVGSTNNTMGDPDSIATTYIGGVLTHPDGHSKILGFAIDGYPIYGPYGYSNVTGANATVKRMVSRYKLRNASYRATTDACDLVTSPMGMFVQDYELSSQGDLDQYNGRYCVTPDYPDGTYAYFTTINANGTPAYPYVIGPQFYGNVIAEVANSIVGGSGYAPVTYRSTPNSFDPLSESISWTRFSHRPNVETQPASVAESFAWAYDNDKNLVECRTDTQSYTGFISFRKYSRYTHDVVVSSTAVQGGAMAVVLAFAIDKTGREHTLSAIRAGGAVNNTKTWSIVYNYLRSDEWEVYNGSESAPGPNNWNNFPAGSRIVVAREDDIISAKCSQFNSLPIDESTLLTVNLTTDPRLEVFRGEANMGYSSHAQKFAQFKNIRFRDLDAENVSWEFVKGQSDIVDISSISSMYLFNKKTKTILTRLDFLDPIKGKILGSAEADIDFKIDIDPAQYNVGSDSRLNIDDELHWGEKQVGKIWWDTDTIRYIDYEQSDNNYRVQHWAEMFEGSTVNVYEWVASDVLPSQHVAQGLEGVPKFTDDTAFVQLSYVDDISKEVRNKYYYWVKDRTTTTLPSKSHSAFNIAYRIEEPTLQGIPYAAVLRDNAVALYNIGKFLSGSDTALHVEYKVKVTENVTHSEYQLFQQDNATAVMDPRIENKLIDSLVGMDENGALVPDPTLLPGDQVGLSNKPRQTIILNRKKAISDVLKYVNTILIKHPTAGRIVNSNTIYSDNFYAADPEPAENRYDYTVDTEEQVDYVPEFASGSFEIGKQYIITEIIDFDFTTVGASSNTVGTAFTATSIGDPNLLGFALPRRIYVKNDENYTNRWTIYRKNITTEDNVLVEVQGFDTANSWEFADWFADGYNIKTLPTHVVDTFNDIYKINLNVGDIVKVKDSGNQLFDLYRYDINNKYTLIGKQNGTIQIKADLWNQIGFDRYEFDNDPWDFSLFNELRFILKGLKHDVFVKDLAEYYNKILFILIDFVLAEQQYSDWIFKTSFLSIKHRINALKPSTSYIRNRQEFYEEYVNEVKPYRTKVREYNMEYHTTEPLVSTTFTDFDLPSYYDQTLGVFRSPNGQFPDKDANLLATRPEYQDWNNNYKFEVESVELASPGFGHLVAPDVSVIPTDLTGGNTVVKSTISLLNGSVQGFTVEQPGGGYTTTPLITVNGSGTTQLSKFETTPRKQTIGSVRLNNNKIRKIKTSIRFDRVQYTTQVVDWQANTSYPSGTYVSYNGNSYINSSNVSPRNKFARSDWMLHNSANFDNANDRVMSSYSPTPSMIPKVLSRLMTGLDNQILNANTAAIQDTAVTGGGFTGVSIPAGNFVPGTKYIVTNVGTTEFTSIGAHKDEVGVIFVANAAGTGTGSATIAITSNAFSTASGFSPDAIVAQGGTFVSDLFSHAPEEFLPGRTYDSVVVTIMDNNGIGAKLFVNMSDVRSASEVSPMYKTTLVSPLNLTDRTIEVADASNLPVPNVFAITPGIIHINGERIEYYTLVGNTLGQLRRGVGGTSVPLLHSLGSTVEAASVPATGYVQLGNT
jgi:hypothetical protein